ncbi:MAG: bh protein [Actinomycetota bacterium]|nr:bh protein [Actinomycetota bacterium]
MKLKDKKTKIVLYCISCNRETPHTVYYIGSYLRSVVCDVCKKRIEIDRRHLRTVFAEDFIDRILTKPHRITEDMKKAFASLIPFLPKRLFKEPLAVLKEIYAVLKKENGENKRNGRSGGTKE